MPDDDYRPVWVERTIERKQGHSSMARGQVDDGNDGYRRTQDMNKGLKIRRVPRSFTHEEADEAEYQQGLERRSMARPRPQQRYEVEEEYEVVKPRKVREALPPSQPPLVYTKESVEYYYPPRRVKERQPQPPVPETQFSGTDRSPPPANYTAKPELKSVLRHAPSPEYRPRGRSRRDSPPDRSSRRRERSLSSSPEPSPKEDVKEKAKRSSSIGKANKASWLAATLLPSIVSHMPGAHSGAPDGKTTGPVNASIWGLEILPIALQAIDSYKQKKERKKEAKEEEGREREREKDRREDSGDDRPRRSYKPSMRKKLDRMADDPMPQRDRGGGRRSD